MTAAETIPLYLPYLGPEVHEAAHDALDQGWIAMGPLTKRFEQALSSYLELDDDRPLVATSSCTSALHLACELAGAGPGDEVVVPAFTYVADHQAIGMSGAEPVFCDVDEKSLCADPASIESLLSERTKAILVVHYAGEVADMDAIWDLGRRHGIRVIEDAAHAFGSRYQGRPVGAVGDLTCFSFGPVKMITSLEGGAIVTPRPDERDDLEQMRLLGCTSDTAARYEKGRAWDYDVVRQGFRYHLGSIPAAIGLSQLAMVETFIANRQTYCKRYNEGLSPLAEVSVPTTDFDHAAPYIYVVRVPSEVRTDLMACLKEQGIITGIHYFGAHRYSQYGARRAGDLSVTERVSGSVVSLPLHHFMEEAAIDRVIGAVHRFFGSSG